MRQVCALIILTLGVVLTSCERGGGDNVVVGDGSGISLRVDVDNSVVEGSAFNVQGLKVANSQLSAPMSAFANGDKVGVYLAESGRGLAMSGNAVNNQLFSFNGTSWSASDFVAGGAGSGTSGNIIPSGRYNAFGYYPYSASVDDATQIGYTLISDQSAGIDNSKMLMWGRVKSGAVIDVVKGSAAPIDVELTFINRLSYVTIKGSLPAKYNNRDVGSIVGVKLVGALKECKLNLANGDVITNPYSLKSDVVMYQDSYNSATKEYSYSAIAIPDTLIPSQPLAYVEFSYNDGTGDKDKINIYAPISGMALRSNTRHTITSVMDYLDCYTTFEFATAGGTIAADIKSSSTAPYTLAVKTGGDWLTVIGDATTGYSVKAIANTTTLARIGELILTNGTLSRSIAVLQLK